MLISFSVQNYRSFAERQTLSMVAGNSAKQEENFVFQSGNSMAPNLLHSACLLGANASGKSNFILAMNFFRQFVANSAKEMQKGEKIKITPNKLIVDFAQKPSEFEIIFIHNGQLYQYGFVVDHQRVLAEWLFAKPNDNKSRIRRLFERNFDETSGNYNWEINSLYIKGQKELWKKSTRSNALFLSQAVQLNSEDLTHPFEWIVGYLIVLDSPENLSPHHSIDRLSEPEWQKRTLSLLQSADIHIHNLGIEEVPIKHILADDIPPFIKELILKDNIDAKRLIIKAFHENDIGDLVEFDFSEESDGTQALFKLAAPLLDALDNGYCLVVDELHNSLHPHLLDMLIKLFHNPIINKKNVQLIFTCHETSIMAETMHKDQIWFAKKSKEKTTRLIPLSDFKTRDSNYQKAYLDGRYGAIPKIEELT